MYQPWDQNYCPYYGSFFYCVLNSWSLLHCTKPILVFLLVTLVSASLATQHTCLCNILLCCSTVIIEEPMESL